MNLTQLRQTIYAMGGGLVVTAGAAVVWSLGSLEPEPDATTGPPRQPTVTDESPSARLSPGPVATTFDQPLQKSLYDPPKKPTKPKVVQPRPTVKTTPVIRPPKPPKLDWTLLGTIIESGQSIAIIADASGKTDIRAIGEEVELVPAGVLVRKIDSEVVTLEVRGKESKLKLLKDFASSGNATKNRRRNNR
ncbi:MAG: hypothetical protein AAFU85_01265 [Planctomycetota bacterium]